MLWLPGANGEVRQWADARGIAQLTAEFVRFDGGDVILRSEEGTVLHLPESGLRATDRNYLQQIRTNQKRDLYRKEAILNEGYVLHREFVKKVRGRWSPTAI